MKKLPMYEKKIRMRLAKRLKYHKQKELPVNPIVRAIIGWWKAIEHNIEQRRIWKDYH